ncbi:MAG: CDP-alcohol phosphatidyltransferase family protein [Spirochaetes bacterium]|nr:CDP-alcohol phosphatidyltransferase family protein [Spirochaetota bacterium]
MSTKLKNKSRNITAAVIFIWLFGILCFTIFSRFVPLLLSDIVFVILIETILCIVILTFFLIKIDWFKDMHTGKEIHCLNISNTLSSLRFTQVPILVAMFHITLIRKDDFMIKLAILIFIGLVWATDLADGYLARKLGEVTRIGTIIDPVGDFLMITSFTLLLFNHHLISNWLFGLIIFRIPFFFLVMILLNALKIKYLIKTSKIGRTTIFYLSFFIGFNIIKLFFHINQSWYDSFLLILQVCCAVILIVSIIEKFYLLYYYLTHQQEVAEIIKKQP